MRVKLLQSIACPHGTGNRGEIVDLPEPAALGLIDGGFALAVDLEAPVAVEPAQVVENASAEPVRETATEPKAPAKRSKRRG
ncbi:MAG TPA: hypothetical protein VGE52_00075, partial [Pirellulales bacterium]